MNFKDWFAHRQLLKEIKEETESPPHIIQSRNHLLNKARGSIRLHLQQQLTEALKKFQEAPPADPKKLV